MKNSKNLNEFQIENDGTLDYLKLEDNSTSTEQGISVYFRNIEENLVKYIEQAPAVFGAVAWLTSNNILDSLAKVENVQIIVQKEDFLKPDTGYIDPESWKSKLHGKYSKLKCSIHRGEFEYWILGATSLESDYSLDPVRCFGNYNFKKLPAFPRMHNKFLVFANVEVVMDCGMYPVHVIKPYAVWTGSFNFSENATNSLENSLYITDKKIVNAYFKEYTQIAAVSEKLNWDSKWIKPEWHVGV
ncbi:phospholipase D-like domain-containing protein [Pseudoalteromonas sp. N1230-9]|uniref:hypothetical protein n=1 Tax=Pseudoalteromonas sp. N1230-9 TaxID=2907156 RepID=UPI002B2A4110|nr:phospholipase D-like domain-containing protein [Pseudoalteromonas sp. N1230-9]